jgi:hypothetical protein
MYLFHKKQKTPINVTPSHRNQSGTKSPEPVDEGFYLSPSYQKPDLSVRNQRIQEVMPIGDYTVKFRMSTMDNTMDADIRLDVYANRTILNTATFKENKLMNDTLTGLVLNFTLPDIV